MCVSLPRLSACSLLDSVHHTADSVLYSFPGCVVISTVVISALKVKVVAEVLIFLVRVDFILFFTQPLMCKSVPAIIVGCFNGLDVWLGLKVVLRTSSFGKIWYG